MSCSDYFDNFIFTMIEFAIDLQTDVLQCNKRMCYEMRGCFYLFCSFCLLCTHYFRLLGVGWVSEFLLFSEEVSGLDF